MYHIESTPRAAAAALISAFLLLLAGCSGGSSGDGTGGSGASAGSAAPAASDRMQAASVGTVTGFGSVVVDGEAIDDAAAKVEVEGEAGLAGVEARRTDLRLGHRLEVTLDAAGRAASIRVQPEIIGPVSTIDATAKTLTVNGALVKTNDGNASGPATVYDGYSGFAAIAVGDRVEIHGMPVLDASGHVAVQATRIERRPAGTVTLVTGVIANLAGGAFNLGTLAVRLAPTVRILPPSTTLANGMRVAVLSSTGVAGGVLTADIVRVRRAGDADTLVKLAGTIADWQTATKSFKLGAATVDASAATIEPAAAVLGNDLYVIAQGTLDATANKLAATRIVVLPRGGPPAIALAGNVSDFVSTADFKVRGALVDATGATVVNGTLATIADNVYLIVRGAIQGGVVKAATITIVDPASLGRVTGDLAGSVASFDAASGRLVLNLRGERTVEVTIGGATTFQPAGKSATDLVADARVRVHGTLAAGKITASQVKFLGALGDPRALQVEGIVANVMPARFDVDGMTFEIGAGVTLPAGFANGARVRVTFTVAGSVKTATAVRLDD